MPYQEVSTVFLDLNQGDEVEGVFICRETIEVGEAKDEVSRYTFMVEEGAHVSFLGGASIDRTFDEKDIKPGERIKVRHDGEKELKGGRSVKLFRIWRWIGDPPDAATSSA